MDVLRQKDRCLAYVLREIEKLEEQAQEEFDETGKWPDYGMGKIGYTMLQMLKGVLGAQEIREPLDDVVFFAGIPRMDSMCYHVLVRPEARRQMEADPNISMCSVKKFTGVMDQDNKPKRKLVYDEKGKARCAECGERIYPRYRPHSCRSCGTLIDWSDEWWYKDSEQRQSDL